VLPREWLRLKIKTVRKESGRSVGEKLERKKISIGRGSPRPVTIRFLREQKNKYRIIRSKRGWSTFLSDPNGLRRGMLFDERILGGREMFDIVKRPL